MTKKKFTHEFTVKRSKWGTGGSWSNLDSTRQRQYSLFTEGTMCCLGHARVCFGIKNVPDASSPADAKSHKWPSSLVRTEKGSSGRYEQFDTDLCQSIMCTNDDESIDNKEREKLLKSLFAKGSIKVNFVD
jgi:hypothetical protein